MRSCHLGYTDTIRHALVAHGPVESTEGVF